MSDPLAPHTATPRVRRATEADIDGILPHMVQFNVDEGIAFTPEKGWRGLEALMHNHGWGFVLVLERGGAIVGYALCAFGFDIEYGGRDAFLCELFVAEDARGQGLGKVLIDAAEAAVQAEGAAALHLIVRVENERARRLYEQRGFEPDPRTLMSKRL